MRFRRADPHTLAGAYALDALPVADRTAFERHLGSCDACRQECASLREAAACLGAAVTVAPPAWLRSAVMAQATRSRQHPPASVDADRAAASRAAGVPEARLFWLVSRRPGWLAGSRLRWLTTPRLAGAVASMFVVLALALGGLVVGTQHRLSQDEARGTAVASVLTARDAAMMTVRGRSGDTATVVMSHRMRALVLTTARLPALPSAEAYQVWLLGPHGARPAGMLPGPRHGMTSPVVVTGLAAGDKLGLAPGPAAGSARLTSHPVLMVAVWR